MSNENTSSGTSVAPYDQVVDPEDGPVAGSPFGEDVHIVTRFMRSIKVPSRGIGDRAPRSVHRAHAPR
jgi:hypothetical protein